MLVLQNNFIFTAPDSHDCDFETDLCLWTQDDTDVFDWTRIKGSTSSIGTGPTGDHTKPDGSGKMTGMQT